MESWQDRLAALKGTLQPDTEPDNSPEAEATADSQPTQNGAVNIVFERKGRGGKQATIIEGFSIDDDALQQLASEMKRTLGTGGSARGGEILIQGDRRDAVRKFLNNKGFKTKG